MPHWRAKSTDSLRTYFEEHGYLSLDAVLGFDEPTVDRIVGSLSES